MSVRGEFAREIRDFSVPFPVLRKLLSDGAHPDLISALTGNADNREVSNCRAADGAGWVDSGSGARGWWPRTAHQDGERDPSSPGGVGSSCLWRSSAWRGA